MGKSILKSLVVIGLIFINLNLYGQNAVKTIKMTTPIGAKGSFEGFIKKNKFGIDNKLSYKGIRNGILRSSLTKKVNLIAKDFMAVSSEEIPTDIKYQKKIMYGLDRFNDVKKDLSKEDRARVCHYIIELMDIVDLKSSRGLLNMFTYGFDPSTMKLGDEKK